MLKIHKIQQIAKIRQLLNTDDTTDDLLSISDLSDDSPSPTPTNFYMS